MASKAEALTPPRRPRAFLRPRVLVAAAVVVLAAGVAAAALAWRSYEPLAFTGGTVAPNASAGVEWRIVETMSSSGTTVYALDRAKPGTFVLGFDLRNTGRLPVTLGSPPPEPGDSVRMSLRVSVQREVEGTPPGIEYVSLDGVTMAAGESRRLLVTYRWTSCGDRWSSGSFVTYSHVRVRLTSRGGLLGRTQWVELPAEVVLVCGDLPRPNGDLVRAGG